MSAAPPRVLPPAGIVGRNGSRRSSLAEATELVLTGDDRRWSALQRSGPTPGGTCITLSAALARAELAEEGRSGPTVVELSWQPGDLVGLVRSCERVVADLLAVA